LGGWAHPRRFIWQQPVCSTLRRVIVSREFARLSAPARSS